MTALPIALTQGDPSGIGPEIAVKAWDELRGDVPFVLIGDFALGSKVAAGLGVPVERVEDPAAAAQVAPKALPILHHAMPVPSSPGIPETQNAGAVVEIIQTAVAFAQDSKVSAIVTNPINKKVLHDGAGFRFPGHTEYLADLAGAPKSVMMLSAPGLRVVPVTTHIALSEVPHALTPELLRETITIVASSLVGDFAISVPRLAVAGLNPHAGEGGNMGREEVDWIKAEIDALRATGLNITGPVSADTMFHPEARARYDAAICMYHDQALIPLKTIDFAHGVNTTLGLPFVRTSPDHGTAYDIAGKGIADPRSLIAALKQASEIAARRAGP